MRIKPATCRAIRRRLLARASTLALQVALRPRGWASGLLVVGLIGAPASAMAGETIATSDANLIIQGRTPGVFCCSSVSGAGDVNGDGIDDVIIGSPYAHPNGRDGAGASFLVFGTDQGFPPIIGLPTNADVSIKGAAADDRSGRSVSGAGDVNGDGFDDVIVGAPYADPKDREFAGTSYVVFGALDLSGTIDLATDADLIIQGAATNDASGRSVSGAGDVNGDGIDDLIIGAPYADPNGRPEAGASYVVFGTDEGFPATVDLAVDADLVIEGAAAGDYSGISVGGAGDVNGDGIDDLIIGATGADPDGRDHAGAAYVVLGAMDLAGTIDLADATSGADVIIQGGAANEYAGSVSGAGDTNGDGVDDLLIGAPLAHLEGHGDAGAAYVVFGSAAGLPVTIDLADGADLVIIGAAPYDGCCRPVSGAGDFDGDGIDDLVVGAASAGFYDGGESYVVLGATDLAGTIDLADPVNGAALIIRGAAGDRSGRSVSGAGDFDGDGFDDVIVGAPYADPNGRDGGESYVVFGGPAAALDRLISQVEAGDLPLGLENRLTGNLENVLRAVSKDRLSLAILRLRAFVQKVEAQRGTKIDEADADDWIADARSIIGTLKAQRERDQAPQRRTLSSMAKAP